MVLRTWVWFLEPVAPIPLPLGALLIETRAVLGPIRFDSFRFSFSTAPPTTARRRRARYIYIYIYIYIHIQRLAAAAGPREGGIAHDRDTVHSGQLSLIRRRVADAVRRKYSNKQIKQQRNDTVHSGNSTRYSLKRGFANSGFRNRGNVPCTRAKTSV